MNHPYGRCYETTEKKLTLNDRIVMLTEAILKEDWTPDKQYNPQKGSDKVVEYVSTPKLNRQTVPHLCECGLTLTFSDTEVKVQPPIGVKSNHLHLYTKAVLSDGTESREYTIIAESADTMDKALSFAHTYAKRLFWFTNFPIVDGLAEMNESPASPQDVTANLLRRAIKEPEVISKAEPKPPVNGGAPAEIRDGDTAKVGEAITSPHDGNLSPAQLRAMNNALKVIETAVSEGKVPEEHLKTAREIRANASCQDDVEAILGLRRELNI